MNIEAGNGFQAWKALKENYEPNVGGRFTAMLMGIISPAWENVKEPDFMDALESWEAQVRRYEEQSRDAISETTKVAIIMKHAPPALRSFIRTASTQLGTSYERTRKYARDFLQSGLPFSSTGNTAAEDGGPTKGRTSARARARARRGPSTTVMAKAKATAARSSKVSAATVQEIRVPQVGP